VLVLSCMSLEQTLVSYLLVLSLPLALTLEADVDKPQHHSSTHGQKMLQ
jgi:hypothetical protein